MGFLLTDTIPLTVYQYDRENQVWVSEYPEEANRKELNLIKNTVIRGGKELVISVSVSGIVRSSDIDVVVGKEYDILEIGISNPRVKQVLYKKDVTMI